MEWLNLHTSTLDSPEFVGAEPRERSAWLCLLRFCIGQENGGVIKGCREWTDRRWQQLCRVTEEEVSAPSELWKWKGTNLVVWAYPLTKENEIRIKREAGKAGAAIRWFKADSSAKSSPNSLPSKEPYAEGEGEGEEERKEKEKGKNTPPNPQGGDVPAGTGGQTPPPADDKKRKRDPQPAFQPPSYDEWLDYAAERGWTAEREAAAAFDHYETVGWRYGQHNGKPIKDWRAALRTCHRRAELERGGSRSTDGGGQAGKNRGGAARGNESDWVSIDLAKEAALIASTGGDSAYPVGMLPRDDAHLTADEAWALQQSKAEAAKQGGAS